MTEFRCPFCNGELEIKAKQEPKKPFRYPKEFNDYWKRFPVFEAKGHSKRDVYEWWNRTNPEDDTVVAFEKTPE